MKLVGRDLSETLFSAISTKYIEATGHEVALRRNGIAALLG
jgi:hypothetical protein